VLCRPDQSQKVYALAVAFEATLPTELARFREVVTSYALAKWSDPGLDKVATIRAIIAKKAVPQEHLPGRPLDPRTEAEAALAAGGWSDAEIALMTDPDQQPWQEDEGARRVSRRLARHRAWYSGTSGPLVSFFKKVNPRISRSPR
jgi:hypothetical protein